MAKKGALERISDLAHHARAIKDIIRAAMHGGFHAAALQAVKHYWPQILIISLVLLLMPIIVFVCLPAMLFGFGSAASPEISTMNMQAETLQSYYDSYKDYYNERIDEIQAWIDSEEFADMFQQSEDKQFEYEVVISGEPMEKNWFIALHSVTNQNDLNQMTEQSIRDFVERAIACTVEEPESDDEASSSDEDTVKLIVTIQYLTPSDYMEFHQFSAFDRSWAEQIFQALQEDGG